ncbi:cell envelope integrity protein TolA [Kangiella sp. TOML190]|uniref:cell envelope integrity protein TolA n=1 Tax=Kangiella sp. TOML190 TaxID=2931351 RepID=UPI00203A64F4|nr:cell envelope integrity protein TolA [Kangiella sp. TOML190]
MPYKKNIVPVALAILLHVGLIGLLLWNFAFSPDETNKQFVDSPVKARLVTAPEIPKKDATSLKKKQQRQKELDETKKKLEQQKLEEQKQKELEQERLKQQKLEQEQAEKLKQQKLKQEQLEQKKLEQQKKAEAEKKRKAEAEKKRKAEAERKKKEAEKKKKAEAERKRKEAERKKREEAERKRKELEALEASLDDELFEADKGAVRQSQIMSEVEKLRNAIGAKVRRNWNMPSGDGNCVINFTIGPGGILLGIKSTDGDLDYCDTGTTAIRKSAPFPVSDDPQVMAVLKDATIKFDPSFKQ